MKLYQIPKESRIKTQTLNEKDEVLGEFIIFHHLDGMYSFCTVEGKPKEVCHLYRMQKLKKEKDYYVLVN